MAEYKEPTFVFVVFGHPAVGWLLPTTQVGQFGLVVKCEFPRKAVLV